MGNPVEHSDVMKDEAKRIMKETAASETDQDIIQELVRTRKNLGMTQKDLSFLTGVTQADISRIESGTRNPSLKLIKRLAKGVGLELKLVPAAKGEEAE